MKYARLALPWLLAAGILAAIFARVDARAVLEAVRGAELRTYLPLAVAFSALWLALDATVLRGVFARAGAPLPLGSMALARAATYPWMALSFDLANAALVARVKRKSGAPLGRLLGAMLVHYACDLFALSATALAASLAPSDRVAALLRPIALAVALGSLGVVLAARLGLAHLSDSAFTAALRGFSGLDLARVAALRSLFYASFALFVWLTLPSFGLSVPFADVLARMPLVQSLAALPIAPAGLGTAQAAMLALFAGFGPPERWLAYGLAYSATLIAVRVPVGFAAWSLSARCDARLAGAA